MKQASLKLKNYASNVNIIDNGNLQRRILNMMLFVLGGLALFYVFLLGNMVFNIVERKALEVHALNLQNEVGNLELEYLSKTEKIDLDLAYSLGFKEIKTKFATRKALGSIKVAKNEI
ncbi:MAG: hypothetical protein NDI62_03460 [Burkholderiales bacterium]|nr:hypothetical protein [Burkholderiales bacterium]